MGRRKKKQKRTRKGMNEEVNAELATKVSNSLDFFKQSPWWNEIIFTSKRTPTLPCSLSYRKYLIVPNPFEVLPTLPGLLDSFFVYTVLEATQVLLSQFGQRTPCQQSLAHIEGSYLVQSNLRLAFRFTWLQRGNIFGPSFSQKQKDAACKHGDRLDSAQPECLELCQLCDSIVQDLGQDPLVCHLHLFFCFVLRSFGNRIPQLQHLESCACPRDRTYNGGGVHFGYR